MDLGLWWRRHIRRWYNCNKSSPVQIGSLTDWADVSVGNNFTLALKTDGTIWSWGSNDFGNIRRWYNSNKSSPVQIGSLTTWNSINAMYSHAAAILEN
jgi:alpha-tubulin suppressor-like RCC1 family protein